LVNSFQLCPHAGEQRKTTSMVVADPWSCFGGHRHAIPLRLTKPYRTSASIASKSSRSSSACSDNAVAVYLATSYSKTLQLATLTVSDNGRGIPDEDKPRLFEPYFSTKKSGTGLGLAIVSTIISDHNGYIRVRDNEPRGTRFIVELPVTGEARNG
jgi:two-component system nitrogen regulation sensor histidine kinase NtrY